MGYIAALADPSHREAIAQLWADNMSDRHIASVIDQRWRWLYEDPRAAGVKTWVVQHDATRQVVGCASLCPRTLHVDGRQVRAGMLSDFAIAKAHRVAGPAIALQRKVITDSAADGTELVFGHPNRSAVPIFTRVGYRQLGTIAGWAKPLRSAKRLPEYMSPALAQMAAPVADIALATNDLRLLLTHAAAYRDVVLARADYRFDDLWERGKHGKPATVARSSAYLNWRYADFTTASYQLFAISKRFQPRRLRGYVAWRKDRDMAWIADLFWEGGPATLRALLIRFACRMRREGLDSVHIVAFGDQLIQPSLKALQFFPVALEDRPVIAFAGEALGDLTADPGRWLLFDGDLDI